MAERLGRPLTAMDVNLTAANLLPHPAAAAGTRAWNYPPAIFDLHLTCNQNCPYCVAGAGPKNDFGRITDPRDLEHVRRFLRDYGPFNLILTGGEPLITPGIGDLLEFLVAEGHIVSMQTNLKTGPEKIIASLPPDRTGWILATLHSVALPWSERFIRTAAELRAAGFPVLVKLVLDRVLLGTLVPLHQRLMESGLPVILSPLIHFPSDGEAYPQTYTAGEWAVIAPRITLKSSWLYFAGGWRSRGFPCRAGAEAFYLRVNTGEVGGCAHNFPDHRGDIYRNDLRPLNISGPCGLDLCLCDYNYYAGLPLNLDERARFQALLGGDPSTVSHEEYLDWIGRAGIQAVNDLRPLLPAKATLRKA